MSIHVDVNEVVAVTTIMSRPNNIGCTLVDGSKTVVSSPVGAYCMP